MKSKGDFRIVSWMLTVVMLSVAALPLTGCKTRISNALSEIRLGVQDNLVHTLAGQKDPVQGLKTTGKEGVLMYGPYLPVKEGEYKVTIFGKMTPIAGQQNVFDVFSGTAKRALATKTVSGPEAKSPSGEEVLATMEFVLARDVPDLEIRAMVTPATQMTITSYVMVSNK